MEKIVKLVDAKFLINEKFKAARNLSLALEKPKVERLIKESTDEEFKQIMKLLEDLNKDGFTRWYKRHANKEFFDLPISEIREIAATKYHITNARRMDFNKLRAILEDMFDKEDK